MDQGRDRENNVIDFIAACDLPTSSRSTLSTCAAEAVQQSRQTQDASEVSPPATQAMLPGDPEAQNPAPFPHANASLVPSPLDHARLDHAQEVAMVVRVSLTGSSAVFSPLETRPSLCRFSVSTW